MSEGKYRDMELPALLEATGARAETVAHITRIADALTTLGAEREFTRALRHMLASLASLREGLGVQVGDRVRVRPELVAAEAGRWKNSDHASTCRTFSEDGDVLAVSYNEWHDRWYALVRFDAEYWKHYQTGEWQNVDRRHSWSITLDAVEVIGAGTYGGKHERVVYAGSAQA